MKISTLINLRFKNDENYFFYTMLHGVGKVTRTRKKKTQMGNDSNNYKLILEGIQKLQSLPLLYIHIKHQKNRKVLNISTCQWIIFLNKQVVSCCLWIESTQTVILKFTNTELLSITWYCLSQITTHLSRAANNRSTQNWPSNVII